MARKTSDRIASLRLALSSFEEFSREDLSSNMAKAALVKAFEFTFELAWKSLKAAAEERGMRAPSPRDALVAGLQLGIISDEATWLQMKDDRNTTAHTYSVDYLPELLERLRSRYIPAVRGLLAALQEEGRQS